MKDSEFLELLNLYLDHEIAPEDAARLEAEVRANPERRRTYLQYCRMQKACTLLAAEFAADRPAPRRETIGQRLGWAAAGFASFGVVAAGLAVAFVLWQRSPVPQPASGPALAVASPAQGEPQRGLVAATNPAAPRLTLVGESLALSGGLQVGGNSPVRSPSDQLEWLRNFQVATVPVAGGTSTLRFDHSAQPQRPEARQLGLKAQAEAAEMTAFRFAK
jgi:anti-sigma factor RsiW